MFGSQIYVKRRLRAISPTLWATDRVVTHERAIYKSNFTTERRKCLLRARVFLSFGCFRRAIRSLLPVTSRVEIKTFSQRRRWDCKRWSRQKIALLAIWVEGERLFREKFSGREKSSPLRSGTNEKQEKFIHDRFNVRDANKIIATQISPP